MSVKTKPNEIDSYLLNEMNETERENFEDRFLDDDDLFAEIADRENELVDRYVRGELAGDVLTRFESSLAANPARREKIANSRVLREFIADERAENNKTIPLAERTGFFSKMWGLFSVGSPALQLASLAALFLLGVALVLLLIGNRQLNSLESQLAEARQRESELAAQIESAQEASGELTDDLAAERERVRDLERELARQISAGSNVSPPEKSVKPTIATVLLVPGGIRGPVRPVQRIEIPSDVSRASVVVELPTEFPSVERVSIKLNGESIGGSIRVRTNRKGERTVTVAIPVGRIADARNELEILDEGGKVLETYLFSIEKRK